MIWSQWPDLNLPQSLTCAPTNGKAPEPEDLKRITFFVPLYMGGDAAIADIPKMGSLKVVQSPLLGRDGAAAIFGPQKGATTQQIEILENGLERFASLTGFIDSPGSGAAGGTAYGLCALWSATIESGAAKIAEMCGIDEAIAKADLIITGEGRLDTQSFQGKAVSHISERASAVGVPIAYCVGSIEGGFPSTSLGGVVLSHLAGSSAQAMENPERYLIEAGVQLTHLL